MQPDNHAISHRVQTSYKAGFIKPNPDRDLAHYDMLPREVREALDEAPWGIDSVAAFHHLRIHGIASVLREIRESCDGFYAAFERETGIPRPVKPLGRGAGRKQWVR
jgi:hypothetical protein